VLAGTDPVLRRMTSCASRSSPSWWLCGSHPAAAQNSDPSSRRTRCCPARL